MHIENDQGKTVAILSYITIIGFIIALVMNGESRNKSELGIFHLRQALGIHLTAVAFSFVQFIFLAIPIIGWLANIIIPIAIFVFWILGLIAAINSEKKAVPVVGPIYQNLFAGIG